MDRQRARNTRLIIIVAIFLSLMIIPTIYFKGKAQEYNSDPGYQDLSTYAKVLNGDETGAKEAVEIEDRVTEHKGSTGGVYYTLMGESSCWKLDLNKSPEPFETSLETCNS